jgi:hypothetical protein
MLPVQAMHQFQHIPVLSVVPPTQTTGLARFDTALAFHEIH